MDINALGTQYMNSAFVPFSSSSTPGVPGLQPGGDSAFSDLLKRAQNAEASVKREELPSFPASKKTPIDKTSELYETCLELETFLIKNLLKSMRSTVQKTKLIDTGFAGEMYEDMLYDEYAKQFTRNAGLGFAEMAYRDLTGTR